MNGMGGMPGMPGMGPTGMRNQPKLNAGNSAMQASKLGTGTVDESAKAWYVQAYACMRCGGARRRGNDTHAQCG